MTSGCVAAAVAKAVTISIQSTLALRILQSSQFPRGESLLVLMSGFSRLGLDLVLVAYICSLSGPLTALN